MSSAWLLPEHIADVLPAEARRIEELRRLWLDLARGYGFEMVMPPMLEHLDSLLSGTGRELNLKTFKLVDQLSGRTLGLRADTTPQVARIDAHLLNRSGVTRLCYCGPVVHTRPTGLHATREPLQLGMELFGHAGLEADLEIQTLALEGLHSAGVQGITLDLGDARLVRSLLAGVLLDPAAMQDLVVALTAKDGSAVAQLVRHCNAEVRDSLAALLDLYGGDEVLGRARKLLPERAPILAALNDLDWLAGHVRSSFPDVRVGFDLSDMSGYAYYSGIRFALYGAGSINTLVRGGRYDEVGAVFGRNRPAVGCSLDLKVLAEVAAVPAQRAAVRAPWGEEPALRAAIRQLREHGETVVCMLPGHAAQNQEYECDRELIAVDGQWLVRAL
ncbi:ATP phosphoribosyltransferase regulatory subunit [Ideonella sp.]|uniref:ATP phosphoribosyltransferase regulatory subunit n=1 Tax=Ideonella sp. TaxID=1929293 RepID=UPI003BB76BD4